MISDVPHGSVLGPTLFLLYFNNVEDNIHSRVRHIADNTILYKCISHPTESRELQEDPKKLEEWGEK